MASLERTETSGFSMNESVTIAELEEMTEAARIALLIPTEELFRDCPKVTLSPFFEKLCRGGCEIYLKKIKRSLPLGTRVRICDEENRFFALGEVREYGDGLAIKAIKTFSLG